MNMASVRHHGVIGPVTRRRRRGAAEGGQTGAKGARMPGFCPAPGGASAQADIFSNFLRASRPDNGLKMTKSPAI